MSEKVIYLDNDFEPELRLTRKNASTGDLEAATGLTGLTGRLSATDAGATIHASLSVSLTERGTTGIYYGTIEGDNLRTHLASYAELPVWFVGGDGTNVFVSEPYTVKAVRRPA